MRRFVVTKVKLITCLWLSLACELVHAASGDLDHSFASGMVLTPLGESCPVTAMGTGADGRVVAAGPFEDVFGSATALSFYRADGSPDYGINEFGTASAPITQIADISIQSDGKALVVMLDADRSVRLLRWWPDGFVELLHGWSDVDLFGDPYLPFVPVWGRQAPDGTIVVAGTSDLTGETMIQLFGPDGSLQGVVRHPMHLLGGFAIQSDGKMLLASSVADAAGTGADFAIVRLLPSGEVDSSFGTGGEAKVDLTGNDMIQGCAVQADGKIIAAGTAGSSHVMLRFNANGSLDTSFGAGGHVLTSFSTASQALTPMPAADGRLYALGLRTRTDDPLLMDVYIAGYNSDGSLRPGFGSNGVAETGLVHENLGDLRPDCFASCLSDGKIQVGGKLPHGTSNSFALVRLTSDGARDGGYGGGVLRLTGSSDAIYPNRSGGSIALRPDGGILFPSRTYNSSDAGLTEVHAILPNGKPDPAFGAAGILTLSGLDDSSVFGSALTLRSDGRFVIGGERRFGDDWTHSQRLADGSPDPAFNGGLVSFTDLGPNSLTTLSQMKLDSSGRNVSVGYVINSNGTNSDMVLCRHLADGSLDGAFGMAGLVRTDIGRYGRVNCMEIQSDGRILVGGDKGTSDRRSLIARYLSSGSLDTSFGNGGVLSGVSPVSNLTVADLVILPDQLILVVFANLLGSASHLMCRLLPDGSLDASFGAGGFVSASVDEGSFNFRAAEVQKDLRLVVTGRGNANSDPFAKNFVVVFRYEADGTLDQSFGMNGRRFVATGGGSATGLSVTVQPDNQILLAAASSNFPQPRPTRELFLIRLDSGPLLANLTLDAPSERSETGVRLRGTVNPNGFATTARFEYGTTVAYGQNIALTLVNDSGSVPQNVETLLSGLAPGTTYHYRLTATTAAGTRSTANGTFSTFISLESWRQLHFGSAVNGGAAADMSDLDMDGVPNLLEWACGLLPAQASPLNTPVSAQGGMIDFTYTRDTAAVGAVYQVEWSDSLPGTAWSSQNVTEVILGTTGSIQTVKASLPAGSNGSRFVRLRVQGPP